METETELIDKFELTQYKSNEIRHDVLNGLNIIDHLILIEKPKSPLELLAIEKQQDADREQKRLLQDYMENLLDFLCNDIKSDLQKINEKIIALKTHKQIVHFNDLVVKPEQIESIKVNIMLAYQHLEDAQTRIEKISKIYEGDK
jgi:hypothetical protein